MALKNKKEKNFSEWYTELVSEAGAKLADIRYGIQGFIVHRPWTVKIVRVFEKWFEDEVEKDGYQPLLLPVLIPKKNIEKEKEHVQFAPELFWVEKMGDSKLEEPLYLRPTGESQLYPMYSLWIRSWKDLPFKMYQSRIMAYRAEPTTRPFLRGREFMFFETHAVFRTHDEVLQQIKKDMEICETVIRKRLGLPFLFFKRPQWDKFAGAIDTYAADLLMPDGKVNQVASTHDLGQRFAKAYNITFVDETKMRRYGWQTCFGPGIWRIMAALISVHGDDFGLVLPFEIAPLQIVIVPIVFEKSSNDVDSYCRKLESILKKAGYRVKYDDSENTAGWKFNEWEMLGVPIRLEIGPKEVKTKKVTLVRRDTKKKRSVAEDDLLRAIEDSARELLVNISKKAEESLARSIHKAKTLAEVARILKTKRGFIRALFCSVDKEGAACAVKLQEATDGGKVRGTLFGKEETAVGRCVVCGKPAKAVVYIAKSY
ncbi:MAG: proline--tRNA ligase [Candidatus Nanoarchaeia archaeon]